jgi:hypothetical protein
MKLNNTSSYRTKAFGVGLSLSIAICGCGGGNYVAPPTPTPPVQPAPSEVHSLQGQWEIVFQSEVSPTNYFVLETNLTQAGTDVFAGSFGAAIYQSMGKTAGSFSILPSRLGGQCDNDGTGQVTFDATLTNVSANPATVSFTITETGALGSTSTTGSTTTDGIQLMGHYSRTAGCGFPEDHGTFAGFQESKTFSSADHYLGNFNAGADAIQISLTSTSPGFGLIATGTYNGTPFTLTGSSLGQSLTLTGSVSGNSVTWFGLYDSTYNVLQFSDSDAKFLGSLHEPL